MAAGKVRGTDVLKVESLQGLEGNVKSTAASILHVGAVRVEQNQTGDVKKGTSPIVGVFLRVVEFERVAKCYHARAGSWVSTRRG
jgi:hypothetical protein